MGERAALPVEKLTVTVPSLLFSGLLFSDENGVKMLLHPKNNTGSRTIKPVSSILLDRIFILISLIEL